MLAVTGYSVTQVVQGDALGDAGVGNEPACDAPLVGVDESGCK